MTCITEYIDTASLAPGDNDEIAEILSAYAANVQLSLPSDVKFEAKPATREHPASSGNVYRELEAYGVDVYLREVAWEAAL